MKRHTGFNKSERKVEVKVFAFERVTNAMVDNK
jgi:hypothetical protein